MRGRAAGRGGCGWAWGPHVELYQGPVSGGSGAGCPVGRTILDKHGLSLIECTCPGGVNFRSQKSKLRPQAGGPCCLPLVHSTRCVQGPLEVSTRGPTPCVAGPAALEAPPPFSLSRGLWAASVQKRTVCIRGVFASSQAQHSGTLHTFLIFITTCPYFMVRNQGPERFSASSEVSASRGKPGI